MAETPILAKFPEDVAKKIREGLANFALPPMGIIKSGPSEVSVDFDGTVLKGKAMKLPCITEVLKTFNKEIYYKCGDISTLFEFTKPENQAEERQKLKVLHEKGKGVSRSPEKKESTSEENAQISPKEKQKRMIEKQKREKFGVEMETIPMDNGLTPPATSIRTEWLQRTPVCECPNQNDYVCKKCGYFPKHKVTEVGEWLFSCLHEKPSEKFEIIEVDLDEWDDADNDTQGFANSSPSIGPPSGRPSSSPRIPSMQRRTLNNSLLRQPRPPSLQRQQRQFLRRNPTPAYPYKQSPFRAQRPTMPFSMSRPPGHRSLNPRLGGPRMPGGSPLLNSNKQNAKKHFLSK